MFEPLEKRVHLSATLNGYSLDVVGTPGDDVITFRKDNGTFTVIENGVETTFDFANIERISVSGLEGNDLIIAGRNGLPVRFNGGDGDDTLSGGVGNDLLIGGDGADLIYGLEGDDWIDPGSVNGGGSAFVGDDDADLIRGGDGTDEVLPLDSVDASAATETIDQRRDWQPYFMSFGQPQVTALTRGPGTYLRILATVGASGHELAITSISRVGREVEVHIEARQSRLGALPAVSYVKTETGLGRLQPGPYTVRVIDRSGAAIGRMRFLAPAPAVEIVSAERTSIEPRFDGGTTTISVMFDLPDPGYTVAANDVVRNGDAFTFDVTASDSATSSGGSSSQVGYSLSLGALPPGVYSFTVNVNGRAIKSISFVAP